MARRRPPGPVQIRGTLGTLLRSTLTQVGQVKETLVRQARTQRLQLESSQRQRKYRDALARLGEAIAARTARGELGELYDDPELAARLADIEGLAPPPDSAPAEPHDWPRRQPVPATRPSSPAREIAARANTGDRVCRPASAAEAGAAGSAGPTRLVTPELATVHLGERARRVSALRRGSGIEFVADEPEAEEDLREYMHEDDLADLGARGRARAAGPREE